MLQLPLVFLLLRLLLCTRLYVCEGVQGVWCELEASVSVSGMWDVILLHRLFIAAEAGRVDVARSLLGAGANVNLATTIQDDHGGEFIGASALPLPLALFLASRAWMAQAKRRCMRL